MIEIKALACKKAQEVWVNMTDNFADRLISKMFEKKSVVCVGLDPNIDNIPKEITDQVYESYATDAATGEAITEFNKGIIEAIKDIAVAVKPQAAYYEKFGSQGWRALERTVEYAKSRGLLVILDAKRNDIDETCKNYAAHLGIVKLVGGLEKSILDVDAMTVNGYLGSDGIMPFVNACKENGKGIFVLVKTSNKSSGELQDLKLANGDEVYKAVAKLVEKWGEGTEGEKGYRSVGAVVGATYPTQAEELRPIMPKSIILVPGYGAQGGAASDTLPNFNKDGLGAIVNNARGIIFAYKKDPVYNTSGQYKDAAHASAIKMRDAINDALRTAKICAW